MGAGVFGCGDKPVDTFDRDVALEPALSLSGPVAAPKRRYVMVRKEERCEVRSLEKGVVVATPIPDTACPKDLALGERISLAGSICMRDGGATADRNVPVQCPPALIRAEALTVAGSASASMSTAPTVRKPK